MASRGSSPASRQRPSAACALLALLAPPLAAQPEAESREPRWRFGFELKGHWRDSDAVRFPSPFPFGPAAVPPGQTRVFLETVDAGSHGELSVATVWLEARWRAGLAAKVKLDLVDRYDRNPTSEDREFDLDEAWLRLGWETEPGALPERPWTAYLKLGKFPKPERQDDRHLESYGLVSTAFNRFEDVGLEAGLDLGDRVYLKASFTQGNPLFFRDPNALAGDNGIESFRRPANPDPELKSGFPIFYDADVEDLGFSNPELGVGLGLRLGGASGFFGADVLAWAYDRDLADSVDMGGTFYGGDLDLLNGPGDSTPAPLTGREKIEYGANVWLYAGAFTFFGQIVEQDLAGLRRDGWEIETSWTFELPYVAGAFGRQLFSFVAPAARLSEIDNDFRAHPLFPAPSVFWDWEKVDLGVRIGVLQDVVDLTVEWNDNTFVRLGREESADEFLATVRWEMDWRR